MSRAAVRRDLRRIPRSFALDERYMALIELYSELHDLQRSQALRRLLDSAEAQLDGDTRHRLAIRRQAIVKEARVAAAPVLNTPQCPACGDVDLYVPLADGRWRCDNCLATG